MSIITIRWLFFCAQFRPIYPAIDAVCSPTDIHCNHAPITGHPPQLDAKHIDDQPPKPLLAIPAHHKDLCKDGQHICCGVCVCLCASDGFQPVSHCKRCNSRCNQGRDPLSGRELLCLHILRSVLILLHVPVPDEDSPDHGNKVKHIFQHFSIKPVLPCE